MRQILDGWEGPDVEVILTAGVVPEERALFFISTHVKGVHVGDRRFTDQIKADVAFIVVAEAMGMPGRE